MKRVYLSCVETGVECSYGNQGTQKYDEQKIVTNRKELKEFLSNKQIDIILCSSSMDFPSEYTKDENIIALCNWIRS